MAQMQDLLRRRAIAARWGGITTRNPNTALHGDALLENTQRALVGVANSETIAAPSLRTKVRGLRLGERKLLQALGDAFVLTIGALVILEHSEREYALASMLISLAVVAGFWFFFADAFDAYDPLVIQTRFRNIYYAGKVLVATGISYTLFAWFAGGLLPVIRPRISETLLAVLIIVPLALVRIILLLVLRRVPLRRHVAVVGANGSGHEMVEALRDYGGELYEFLGYFDDAPDLQATGGKLAFDDVLPSSRLISVSHEYGLDQIVLANPAQTPDLLDMISLCHERGIQITPMFALYQDLTGRVPVSHLGNNWFVAMPAHIKSTVRTYMVVKRLLDVILAFVMLIVTAPLFPLIALAIKLDSLGPVLFSQTRVGMGGRPFKIVKFRSMRQDAEAIMGAVWAKNGDSRVTRVGRFLRKSRLDELPQLWNVLVGDMSFVGPRPERPEFEEDLEREIPFYRARRAVRPGLTGWAQVRHGYGNNMFDALRKVEYDLYYIKNESLYLDLLIILRTVAVVLRLAGT